METMRSATVQAVGALLLLTVSACGGDGGETVRVLVAGLAWWRRRARDPNPGSSEAG